MVFMRPREASVAEDEAEAEVLLASAVEGGLPITPRGSGTSIPSQAVGNGLILLQNRNWSEIQGDSVGCTPDVVKSDLNVALSKSGRWVPVDPSSYRSCTVGGMVANNSSGIRTLKYGSTLDYFEEARVVLAHQGIRSLKPVPLNEAVSARPTERRVAQLLLDNAKAIADEAPKVTKNSSGYRLERVVHDGLLDLPKLFAGSEGTLGVFTWLRFSTVDVVTSRSLLIVETELARLGDAAASLRRHGPSALELIDKSVFSAAGREAELRPYTKSSDGLLIFCEIDGASEIEVERRLEKLADDGGVSRLMPMVLTDRGRIQTAWEVRNDVLAIATELRRGRRALLPGIEDLVVPPDSLQELVNFLKDELEGLGLEYISYGHAGDANLHVRPFLDPSSEKELAILHRLMEDCFERVWKMGGSMSGEHGDGRLRAPYVARQYPKTFHLMKALKELYDPKGLMNPGVKIV